MNIKLCSIWIKVWYGQPSESRDERERMIGYCYAVKFVCQLHERNGTWTAEHAGPNAGPVTVTALTRTEALQKLKAEIRYWLEMCPCSGQTYEHEDIELVESGS